MAFDPRPETRPAPAGGAEYWDSLTDPERFVHTISGAVTTGAGKATFTNDTGYDLWIFAVELEAGTAPTGAALIVDVNVDGTSIFTAAGRPQIAAGATTGSAAPEDTVAGAEGARVAPGDAVTFDVDAVGSTVAGSDLTIVAKAAKVGTGGFHWKQIRDGYTRPTLREAELYPLDVNPA